MGLLSKLLAVHKSIKTLIKDKQSFKYKYADLPQTLEMVSPLLEREGLFVEHTCDGGIFVTTVVDAESGEQRHYRLPMPDVGKDPKELGAVCTYMRRYQMWNIFNIPVADEIDARKPQAKKTSHVKQNIHGGKYDSSSALLKKELFGMMKPWQDKYQLSKDELAELAGIMEGRKMSDFSTVAKQFVDARG